MKNCFLIAISLMLFACGAKKEESKSEEVKNEEFTNEETGNDDRATFQPLDPEEHNTKIEQGYQQEVSWLKDPETIVKYLMQAEEKREVNIEVNEKTPNQITVIYTEEKLQDDSVYGEKRVFEFERDNNMWKIMNLSLGFKCQDGRGHDNYSGLICS